LGLINDILDLSRIEAGRIDLSPVILNVREVVGDVIRLAEVGARKHLVTLVQDVPEALPLIRVDERAIRQILLNLLSNAIKFTPEGGKVTISAQAGSSVLGAKGMTITITDTGVGIKKEDMPLVMEAFGQVRVEDLAMTAPREQGTGLGLPITRGLLEAHGGRFLLESTFGVGTRAIIHLPQRCVIAPPQVDEAPSEPDLGAKRA
jgi:two-component system, cell cycle sensor histidine kinase PleC